MREMTIDEMVSELEKIRDEHGGDTPIATVNSADAGEYGTAVWMSTDNVRVEYADRQGRVEIQ